MEAYIEPIKTALLVFPVIAFLITIPYMFWQYHKYGSIHPLRTLIIYSFVLYGISAYFLIILPLPPLEEVASYTTPYVQWIPGNFIVDFMKETTFVWDDPATYLSLFTERAFLQVAYNVLLLLPLGMYLRYYFRCGWTKTILISLGVSLFFELTQLTGLYGIYPRPYRLFDVDDILMNTCGGILGYLLAGIVFKIFPSRERIDEQALKKGEHISTIRRIFSFGLDGCLFLIFCNIVRMVGENLLSMFALSTRTYVIIAFLLYYVITPWLTHGYTISKKLLNMKLVTLEGERPHLSQYLVRYTLLFAVTLPFPMYVSFFVFVTAGFKNSIPHNIFIFVFFAVLFLWAFSTFIYYVCGIRKMIKRQLLRYEKISKTQNKSTIITKETE